MQMKEKLVKNHYKGFDKKAKIFSLASIVLLGVSVCTFVPLTAVIEAKANAIQLEKTQQTQPVDNNTKPESKKLGITF